MIELKTYLVKSAYRYNSGSSLHYPFKDYKELFPLPCLLPKQLPPDLLYFDGFPYRAAANFSIHVQDGLDMICSIAIHLW